jgi:protoheme ferro-lyase
MAQAVNELLAAGCQTIIYQCFCNPVYSDFEDYAYALPLVHHEVNGRAKVICADQLGNQPAMRAAYAQIVHDHLTSLPQEAKILVILSKHGHPFSKETQEVRGQEYRYPLEQEIRAVTESLGRQADVVWSDDEYADEYWDPKNTKLSTRDAYRKAIQEAYDYALEVPTDFVAENTDTMILHAMKKFRVFAEYDAQAPISYPDWEQPLVRTFREGRTTGIYLGCPVGPYRRYIVEATVASVCELLSD